MKIFYFEDKNYNFENVYFTDRIKTVKYTFSFKQKANSQFFPENCLEIDIRFIYYDGKIGGRLLIKNYENLEWSDQDVFVTDSARKYVEKLIKNRMFW